MKRRRREEKRKERKKERNEMERENMNERKVMDGWMIQISTETK